MSTETQLKRTPLFNVHRELGGTMVPFGGWEMPVHYTSLIEEHRAVRERAGIFDVSHMGEIEINGRDALSISDRLVTNSVARLVDGQACYTPICLPSGGIVDDLLVYRFSTERLFFVVNASNIQKDFNWITDNIPDRSQALNLSDQYAQIALQGPRSPEILQRLTTTDLKSVLYYHFSTGQIAGVQAIISRTGYTGEDGFEIYYPAEHAEKVYWAILEAGKPFGLLPCGLGARDTLRLEMKFPLYGNDIDETTTPLEANLAWTVKLDAGEFIGRDSLLKQKEKGVYRKLVGFKMRDRGIPRHGYSIYPPHEGDNEIGRVTSGTMSPTLREGIGVGYLPTEMARVGVAISVEIHGRRRAAEVVSTPFYKHPG